MWELIKSSAGQSFWHPDPVMSRYIWPQPGPDQKIINFMAPIPNWPDYILPGPDRNILSSTRNLSPTRNFRLHYKHLSTPCNEVYCVLIRNNNHSTCSVWEWKACFSFKSVSLSPKSWEKNVSYYGKKIPRPGPTRNKIPWPNPTRKYSLKCSPTLDRFRSSPGKFGVSGPAGL